MIAITDSQRYPTKEEVAEFLERAAPESPNGFKMDVGEVLTIWVRADVIVALLSIHQDFWKFITTTYNQDLRIMNEAMGLPADHPDPDLRCETLWSCLAPATGKDIYVEEVQFFCVATKSSISK